MLQSFPEDGETSSTPDSLATVVAAIVVATTSSATRGPLSNPVQIFSYTKTTQPY